MSHLTKIVVHRDDDDSGPYCEFDREWRGGSPRSFWVESDEGGKSVSRRLQASLDDLEAALMAEDFWGDDLTGDLTTCRFCHKTLNKVDKPTDIFGSPGKVWQDSTGMITCTGRKTIGFHEPREDARDARPR